MDMRYIVFIPSVQHTGTWFTINFLKNFIGRVRELTFILEKPEKAQADVNYVHSYSEPLKEPTITHIHFPIVRHLNFDVNFPEGRFFRDWYANLGTLRSVSIQTILTMANFFKTVIPIRDPVASILSREARHPQLRHFFIVDGFVTLAKEFANHPNVKFLPIDLYTTPESRRKLLVEVMKHCQLDYTQYAGILDPWSENWPVENKTPGNRFKQMYNEGDVDGLRLALGPKMAEIEYLKNMASIILPFMESLGYSRSQVYRGI
jgi:hypothetical protein